MPSLVILKRLSAKNLPVFPIDKDSTHNINHAVSKMYFDYRFVLILIKRFHCL